MRKTVRPLNKSLTTLNKTLTPLLALALILSVNTGQLHANEDSYQPTVLITGANRGMGLEYAKQYAAKGYRVIATARKPAKAEQLNMLAGSNDSVLVEQLDVTDHEAIEALGEKYKDQPIDILLSNAGVGGAPPDQQMLGSINFDAFDFAFAVNTYGPLKLAEVFLPSVLLSEQRKIVAISSNQASIGNVETSGPYLYRVSKAALNMAYRTLAMDVKDQNVIVAVMTPPRTATDLQPKFIDRSKLNTPKDSAADIINTISNLTIETSGSFYGYQSKELPW